MSRTPEDIIEEMRIECPFHVSDNLKPYIIEAMEIYAKHNLNEASIERKKLGKQAMDLIVGLLPPEDYGENMDCDCLQQIIFELSEYDANNP